MLPCDVKHMTMYAHLTNNKNIFIKRPMAVGAVCCCAVSILSFYYRKLLPLFALFATAVVLVFALFLKYDKRLLAVTVTVLAILGSLMICYQKIDKLSLLYDRETFAELTLCEDEQITDNYCTVTVSAKGDGIPRGTKLRMSYYKSRDYSRGDRISAVIVIKEDQNSAYRASRLSENILAKCELKKQTCKLSPNRFGKMIDSVRKYVCNTLFGKMSYKSAATMNALVTGERTFLTEDFSDTVRCAGVSHIMVVSGLHLSIIMGAVDFILKFFGKNRFLCASVSIISVFFIAAVCGFTMSIMRAGLMFVVSAFSPLIERDNDSVNSMGTAIVIILFRSPFAIFSVAFQLSLLSTYAVLALSPEIMRLFKRATHIENRFILNTANMLCVTLSATFMTLPVLIYRFGTVSLTAPVTNILITYAVSAALIIATAGILLNLVPHFSSFCDRIFILCEIAVKYINYIIELLGRKSAVINVGRFAVLPAIFAIFAVLVLIKYCKYKENLLKLKKLKEKRGQSPCL